MEPGEPIIAGLFLVFTVDGVYGGLGLLHEEPYAVKTHLGEEGSVAHVHLGMHSA